MTISVELSNLGPLRSAKADIADLTLLIGKNNTGKTFFATVLHRVINASSPLRPIRWPLQNVPPVLQEWIENQISVYLDQQEDKPSPLETPSEEILEWVNNATDASLKMFGTSILSDIEYAFGAEAHELRRRTTSRRASDCYLRISNTEPDWKIELRFDSDDITTQGPDPNYLLSTLPERLRLVVEERPQEFDHIRGQEFERNSSFHMSKLYRRWLSSLYEGWPQRAVHLPADRTGIMQSHQVLGSALVRQATEAGIRPIEIKSLPGTSADFLSLLINPRGRYFRRRNDKTSGFRASIKRLEEKMRATIRLDRKEDSRDIIVAVTPEGEFPMSRTSSMISELAPMLLTLKNMIGQDDHLTIDEPESSLHPEMQRIIASFLVDIVNHGIGIVLTTHSDFFLGELNNAIRSSKLDRQSVSALLFTRDNKWCTGKSLPIDPIDGIEESNFTDVMEELYNESADLIDELLRKSQSLLI